MAEIHYILKIFPGKKIWKYKNINFINIHVIMRASRENLLSLEKI